MSSITLDIDTGGTFTDGFVVHDGDVRTVKVLTTPHDLAVCFREVVEAAAAACDLALSDFLGATESIRYATTVGTNAVIQRRGPRLGLLAGAGEGAAWRDGTAPGAGLFVAGDMVAEVGRDGGSILEATRDLLGRSARGLVCSLPAGDRAAERDVLEQFEAHHPRHCLDAVPLLLSHEVGADGDDRRRTATALFNAYVHPDVADYLYRAEDWLRDAGYARPLLVVHNDGGCARVAKTIAGKTYNSGPTAGVMGAQAVARHYGIDALVTLDMGGTSLDVALLRDGELPLREHGRVEDVEISFPLPDLLPLGAGGGSIASLDDAGRLRVGPRSAGAKPGPACFGFGGTEPTVTDADVVLGVLDPERFLGGSMRIDPALAERALAPLAERLGCSVVEAAARVRATIHGEMGRRLARELRARGVDPAEVTVLAFGGAGPAHACGIAEAAGVRRILTLPFSPVFSAFGASSADVVHRYEAPDAPDAEEGLRTRALRDMRGEGFAVQELTFASERVGGDGDGGAPRVTLTATRPMPHYAFPTHAAREHAPAPARVRDVHWPGDGPLETGVHDGPALAPGAVVAAPAVIDGRDTTHAVPRRWSYRIDEHGSGWLTRENEEESA